MGLIAQASRMQDRVPERRENKKKSGLLSKIRHGSEYDELLFAFRDFLATMGCERAGLLYPSEDGLAVMLFSSGFDLTTAYRFSPNIADLTDSYNVSSRWYTESGGTLDRFRSYFSSKESESLVAIHLRRVDIIGISCFLVLVESRLGAIRAPITPNLSSIEPLRKLWEQNAHVLMALSRVASANQSVDSMRAHAQSALDTGKKLSFVQIDLSAVFGDPDSFADAVDRQAVYGAILHRVIRQAGSSNLSRARSDFTVRLVLFSAQPIDTDLYFRQIIQPLERIFGLYRVSRIRIESLNLGANLDAIMGFILGAN